ncbi:MAG: hypothetical protein EBZ49_07165 [Proteobacteria bacterium]|nr:hypothetical protein [Pseudomonadota bacterium]
MNNELTPYIEYHPNGNVRVKGQLNSKEQEEGIWEWFSENGNIERRIPYKDGKEDGIVEVFYENGNIQIRTPYKNGMEDGIKEVFDLNGNIRRRTTFKEGDWDGIEEGSIQTEISVVESLTKRVRRMEFMSGLMNGETSPEPLYGKMGK